jgi:hypothetical protein
MHSKILSNYPNAWYLLPQTQTWSYLQLVNFLKGQNVDTNVQTFKRSNVSSTNVEKTKNIFPVLVVEKVDPFDFECSAKNKNTSEYQ